jgi:hypothetical protein
LLQQKITSLFNEDQENVYGILRGVRGYYIGGCMGM